jgi:peptidoglycan hydrolase-like protein with peptidoglycan-binding domain
MKARKSMIGAILLSGAVGLLAAPVWSQEAPGETRQPDPNLTRPGRGEEDIPGIHHQGTAELSENEMKNVEQALQKKGYQVGRVDGVADDDVRKAIRSFQMDNSLPITGMVDEKTADKLDLTISSGSEWNRKDSGMSSGSTSEPGRTRSGDDGTLPSHYRK